MKLRTMLYGLTLMLGCFVLASCVNDEEGPCLPDGKTQVVFTLMLPDNAQTRAWGDKNANYWIEGENKDNDIDLSSIKLLIFNEGKDDEENIIYTYVGTVDDLMYLTKETGTTPYEKTVYECIGTVPEGISSKLINAEVKNFKFVVFANCNVPTEGIKKLDDLEEIAFEPGITTFASDDMSKIPMWGVVSVNNLSLELGVRKDLGTLTLLRAMSKVTVALAPKPGEEAKMDGYGYISKVEVINYNTKGFVVPTDFSNVAKTIDLPEEGCVHENTDAAGTTGFVINGTTDTKQLTFYLLDFVNKEKAVAAQAQLIVTLGKTDADGNPVKEGEGENAKPITTTFDFAPIKFCEYSGGVPTTTAYDIVRNHYYQFNINSVNDDGGLFIVPYVLPWDYNANNSSEFTTKGSSTLTVMDRDGSKYRFKVCDSQGAGKVPGSPDFWTDAWTAIAYDPNFVANGPVNPDFNTLLELTASFEHDSHMVLESSDVNFGFVYRKPKTSDSESDSYSEIVDALTIDETTAVKNTDGSYTVTYYVVPKSTSSEGEKTEVSLIMYSAGMATKLPYNSSILPGSSDNTGAYFYRVSSSVWETIVFYTHDI